MFDNESSNEIYYAMSDDLLYDNTESMWHKSNVTLPIQPINTYQKGGFKCIITYKNQFSKYLLILYTTIKVQTKIINPFYIVRANYQIL